MNEERNERDDTDVSYNVSNRWLDSWKNEWKRHVLKYVAYHVDLLMYAFQASLPDSLPPPVCFSPPSDEKKIINKTREKGM